MFRNSILRLSSIFVSTALALALAPVSVNAASPTMVAAPGSAGCGVAAGLDLCVPSVDLFTNFPPSPTTPVIQPAALGIGPGDIVMSLSFGTEAVTFAEPLLFSVDGPSAGVPGFPPDVSSEAGIGDHVSDIYIAGTLGAPFPNALYADGDGSTFGAAPATGLLEPGDDITAMSSCDATNPFIFGIPTFFTLAPGSPAIAALAAAPEDVFVTPLGSGGPPAIAFPGGAAGIGLMPGDVIDAMATDLLLGPGVIIFSLAPGSPTLGFLGLGPEDLLIWPLGPPGPVPLLPGAALGLAPGDNLDALDAPADADFDSVGDVCDNCLIAPNNDQADLDGDFAGDACDTCTDTDGDGFGNPGFAANICPVDTCEGFDDAMDADADTVPDGCDVCPGFDDTLDADGDMVPDGCDPCSNLGAGQDITVKPKIQLKKINTDVTPGNDGFVMKGEFVLPTGPGAFALLDPSTKGARVLIDADDGTNLVDETLPSGVLWAANGSGTKWKYKDKLGAVNGIIKMDIKDRNKKVADQVQVKVKGKNGTYPVVSGDEPVRVTVVLGDAGSAAAGECGNTLFVLADCSYNGSGSTLKCK